MITWPLRFLAGFIFFAAFVGELSRILQGPAQRHAKKLADRLRQKGMVYGEARVSVAASQSSPARKTGESGYEDAPGRDSRDFALPVVTEQSERILINAKSLANGELFAAESANSDQDVVSLEQRANRTPPSDAL